jgi:hypothetical protein
MFENATLGGYTWYRASDLAIVKEVRTLDVQGSTMTPTGPYLASYKAFVETSYEPALKVWAFPLQPNETWMASSNATIRAAAHWHLTGPNVSWDVVSIFNAKVPVRLFLHSGEAETVVTPAGSFSAISVSAGHPDLDVARATALDASPNRAMGLDHESPIERDHSGLAWFSGTAKNVVQAHLFTLGFRLTLALRSYHLS